MGRPDKQRKHREKKQASKLISVTGILGFTVVVTASLRYDAQIPLYVYFIFAAIIVPPEVLKRILRAMIGGNDEK